jgi:hypothetical protein
VLFLTVSACIFQVNALAQKTVVFGKVLESNTGAPVSFATVYFKGTNIGTVADGLGNFIIETGERHDSLVFSSIGYADTILKIRSFEKQEVRVLLVVKEHVMNEVVIRAGENPAYEILRRAIANKKYNRTNRYETYSYRSYNKVEFDLNNYTDKIKKSLLFRPFPMIWDYQDTLASGQKYLPFLFKENIRDHFYRQRPETYKEYIVGSRKAQFFRGPKIEKFIEELYLNPDLYENFVVILNKSFPSPINDDYKRFYRFLLSDTLHTVDGVRCHHLRFYPKGANDVAFVGEIFLADSSYAIKRVDLNFSIEANINFVRSFWIRMNYLQWESSYWFPSDVTVLADFTVVENSPELTGFFGRRFSSYKNIVVNKPIEDTVFYPAERVIDLDSLGERDAVFFESERGEELTQTEQRIFEMTDSIKAHPRFKLYKSTFNAIGMGWVGYRNFEFGNLPSLISYNDIEGLRLKAGFRTANTSMHRLRTNIYLAYGLKDRSFKYAGELGFVLSRQDNKRSMIGLSALSDVDQIGRSSFSLPVDHFLNYFLQFAPFDTRTMLQNQSAFVERQWFSGFVTRLSLFQSRVLPFGRPYFTSISESGVERQDIQSFSIGGFQLGGRFAYGEKYLRPKYNDPQAKFFMLRYPAVAFEYSYASKGLLSSNFDYARLNIRVEHQLKLNRWGYLSYLIDGSMVFGTVPYVFLSIPSGNQALIADKASFNMMNAIEFASDKSISVHLEHHFDGLFFNRIPVVRNWKLREFLLFRSFMGRLSPKNNERYWAFPDRLNVIQQPYYEVGFGIENILKLGRVDFSWRLNYLENPNTYRFLPKPSFQFRF